jgi:hypothetical protein
MKQFSLFISLLLSYSICAQQSLSQLNFELTFNEKALKLGKTYTLPENEDSISFDVLRFYISDLQFIDNEQIVNKSKKKHILIDLEKPETLQIAIDEYTGTFDKVKFTLGIDSLTNVSGAMGGDLDPMYGMYWTWQSGYINFKLEGQANKCPARKNEFMFHLGGYLAGNLAAQTIELKINKAVESLTITFPIDKLLSQINLTENYRIMSPNQDAVEMSRLIASLFSVERL